MTNELPVFTDRPTTFAFRDVRRNGERGFSHLHIQHEAL
jgi:hypothetical protein